MSSIVHRNLYSNNYDLLIIHLRLCRQTTSISTEPTKGNLQETDEMDKEQLIKCVKKYPLLYNIYLKEHRDSYKRQEAWEEIARAMNSTWEEARHAWSKLRNAYTNALKRRKMKLVDSTRKIPKWKFEDQMAFLLPFSEDRTMIGNFEPVIEEVKIDKDISSDHSLSIYDSDESLSSNSTILTAAETSVSPSQLKQCTPPTNAFQMSKPTGELQGRKRKRKGHLGANAFEQLILATDETEIFYLNIARTVKKLPLDQQIRIKMNICQLVFEAELMCCSSTNSLTVPEENIVETKPFIQDMDSGV